MYYQYQIIPIAKPLQPNNDHLSEEKKAELAEFAHLIEYCQQWNFVFDPEKETLELKRRSDSLDIESNYSPPPKKKEIRPDNLVLETKQRRKIDDPVFLDRKMEQLIYKAEKSLSRTDVYVYFIYCEKENKVKIGRSNDVKARFYSLCGSSPSKLQLLAYMNARSNFDETVIHYYFHEERENGEWFRYSPRLEEYVNIVKNNQQKRIMPYD